MNNYMSDHSTEYIERSVFCLTERKKCDKRKMTEAKRQVQETKCRMVGPLSTL